MSGYTSGQKRHMKESTKKGAVLGAAGYGAMAGNRVFNLNRIAGEGPTKKAARAHIASRTGRGAVVGAGVLGGLSWAGTHKPEKVKKNMISAFGVKHEVSKGFGVKNPMQAFMAGQKKIGTGAGTGMSAAGKKIGGNRKLGVQGAAPVKPTMRNNLGAKVSQAGAAMSSNPMATGAAVTGATAGAVGATAMNKPKPFGKSSAFGVDHGETVSKAAATVGGRSIQGLKPLSSDRAGYLKTSLRTTGSKPSTNAQFASRASGEQRLGALQGRLRHRENYPGSKKLKGFPRQQLP